MSEEAETAVPVDLPDGDPPKAEPGTLTGTLRAEVVKPLDGDWDALGLQLRSARAPIHRIVNSVVRHLELGPTGDATWTGEDGKVRSVWEPTERSVAKGEARCSARTAAYRLTVAAVAEEVAACERRIRGGKELVGDFEFSDGQLSHRVVAATAEMAYAMWQRYVTRDKRTGRSPKWDGSMSLPSMNRKAPVPVKAAGVSITAEDGTVVLECPLFKNRPRVRVALRVDGGHAYAVLGKILRGEVKVGDVKFVYKRRLPAKGSGIPKSTWSAFISYTWTRPDQRDGVVMAVHRGMKCMLSVAIARTGPDARNAYSTVLETGDDVVRHKQGYSARRRSLGMHQRSLGTGAKGHGTERRYQSLTKLEGAEANWVRTKCQEVAAHAVKLALRRGVGLVLVEDWTNPAKDGAPELGKYLEQHVRSFPWAQLRAAIEWACAKAGIRVETRPTHYNSRDCPHCGHRHEAAQYGTFNCEQCRLERSADIVFAWNMLRREGLEPGIAEANAAMRRAKRRGKAAA